ncbi:MAG: 1-(5-phosphoribosyl)-5-[(5-phosphoribosylamino)methylideneamino]imidazole-4-carboxamide isomerase [Clostridia bacterium]|nr:1-(5-phosphoribosyl)-5-[(5-phosphoribosylamino)methylideneamino]imidazole-4-carboxamide isomerase [Clostridia bacterium]
MHIFPAIDLYGGQAVRLLRGDYAQMTVYNPDPTAVVRDFAAAGAEYLHLVDLEGAKTGKTPNIDTIRAILRTADLFTEVGGGIRSIETVRTYLQAGVSRVILGTAAVKDPDFLARAVETYGERIAVGADVKDGKIAIHGWQETANVTTEEFCARMQALGIRTIICTDISKDGVMAGANHDLYRALSEKFSMQFIASGGVSSIEDVRRLAAQGMYGAIIGKAYYTGAVSLREAIEVART